VGLYFQVGRRPILYLRGEFHARCGWRSSLGRRSAWLRFAAAPLLLFLLVIGHTSASAETRELKLYNIHTDEKTTIVFKRNGRYVPSGLSKINAFLRDWRKDQPTKMDPHLLDLVWEVYRRSGSQDYIHVVSGYRSPATNDMLRRRSNGVAKNSLHTQGKAMDFFIPDVDLSKLRVIGLRVQEGGVGFYPTSGAPFVHMDTGNVRHWPRMTRQQLVKVFPDGNTLHVPSDGKPLPGYNQALAAYKARKAAGGGIAVAKFEPPTPSPAPAASEPMVVAAAVNLDEREDDEIAARTPTPTQKPRRAVAVASYSTAAVPRPRLAPKPAEPTVVATFEPGRSANPRPAAATAPDRTATAVRLPVRPDFDFGSPRDWAPPAVPAALAKAMAARDRSHRSTSVPISPTVVATIDVSRPRRAAVMTTAVLRHTTDVPDELPQVLAYAPADAFRAEPVRSAKASTGGMPLPTLNPMHTAMVSQPAPVAPTPAVELPPPPPRVETPALTLTVLDTQALRLWIGPGSTRQKGFALLTMPEYAQSANLTATPAVGFTAGFGPTAYIDLRTDHFSGPLVVQPDVVDLHRPAALIAATR